MPYSKKSSKSKKTYKRKYKRSSRRKVQVSKVHKKLLNDMLNKKLDQAIEDKYKITAFSNIISGYDATNRDLLQELSPAISQGTSSNERLGTKIKFKHLSLMIRMLPAQYNNKFTSSSDTISAFTTNPYREQPP